MPLRVASTGNGHAEMVMQMQVQRTAIKRWKRQEGQRRLRKRVTLAARRAIIINFAR